jgi:hypothetical protein
MNLVIETAANGVEELNQSHYNSDTKRKTHNSQKQDMSARNNEKTK